MTLASAEIGLLAAEQVRDIYARSDSADCWKRLVGGGWSGLGADPDADLDVRAIQEIARVSGQFICDVPLTTTILVGRWFGAEAASASGGATVALPFGHEAAAAPYAASESTALIDGEGAAIPDDWSGFTVDRFAEPMPLRMVRHNHDAKVLPPEHESELHAVLSATAVGCADAVLQRSVDWAQTRVQFEQPIAGFQAVRHILADMHIARELAWTAAIACGHEADRAATWSRMAVDSAMTAIELGIQAHGGVGFTWELGLHHYLRHVMQIRMLLSINV